MARKFCVSLTNSHQDTDKCTLGFVVANAALGSDCETVVFMSGDGVWAAKKGEAEKINEPAPFAPLKELVDKFVAGGGKIQVCSPCMKKRDITEADLINGATPAGGATLVAFLTDGASCVTY